MIEPTSAMVATEIGQLMAEMLADNTLKTALSAVRKRRIDRRLDKFVKSVDVQFYTGNPEKAGELVKYVKSEQGQEELLEYAESAITTDCSIAHLALAFLFSQNASVDLSNMEKQILINGCKELEDFHAKFLVTALNHIEEQTGAQENQYPYPRITIGYYNYGDLPGFDASPDLIFMTVNELAKRRLILPDPQTSATWGNDGTWSIGFGVNASVRKYKNIFAHAIELADQYGSQL